MAKIGLKGFWIGKFSEGSSGIKYTDGKKISKAVQLNENRTINEAKLYADNSLSDSVYSITTMTIDITPDGIEDADLTELIGLTEKEVTINSEAETLAVMTDSDEGAAIGVGIIVQDRTGSVVTHRAKIYANVKFKPSESEENQTRGENLTFTTPSYQGTCYTTSEGYYTFEDSFATEAEAVSFIEKVLAVSPGVAA